MGSKQKLNKNNKQQQQRSHPQSQKSTDPTNTRSAIKADCKLSDLRQDRNLWYKICVLIYDLRNAKDKASANRTLRTTDELYISAPYFSPDEAVAIKTARLDDDTILEQAITTMLQNFFEKRRASGDCRPCGPHDMVPVYMSCFRIDKAEIEDEKFVSRLRRSGLGDT